MDGWPVGMNDRTKEGDRTLTWLPSIHHGAVDVFGQKNVFLVCFTDGHCFKWSVQFFSPDLDHTRCCIASRSHNTLTRAHLYILMLLNDQVLWTASLFTWRVRPEDLTEPCCTCSCLISNCALSCILILLSCLCCVSAERSMADVQPGSPEEKWQSDVGGIG